MIRAMLLALLTAGSPLPPVVTAAAAAAPPALRRLVLAAGRPWPLSPAPAVVRPFHAPPTPWSAGHRGVDLAAAVGQPVLATAPGRVVFAGPVAGRGVVVVAHAGGLRTSYEPVEHAVVVGTVVGRGTTVADVGATAGHCAPATCLHWGLRRGATYLDPLTPWSPDPPVLEPVGHGLSPP